jgi:hypothetical protein
MDDFFKDKGKDSINDLTQDEARELADKIKNSKNLDIKTYNDGVQAEMEGEATGVEVEAGIAEGTEIAEAAEVGLGVAEGAEAGIGGAEILELLFILLL